jgi:hypothetical protein
MRARVSDGSVPMTRGFLAMSIVLFSVLWAGGNAQAQAVFYHSPSNDGSFPAVTPVLSYPGPAWLHLYVDVAGNAPTTIGVACDDGDGDEICGWHVSLTAGPGAELIFFVAAPNVQYALSPAQLTATGVDAMTPGVDPVWIGDLIVQSSDPATGGDIEATGLHVVKADLSVQHVARATVVTIPVPEPASGLMLAAGVVALAGMARRRR